MAQWWLCPMIRSIKNVRYVLLEGLGWVDLDQEAGTIDFDIHQVHPAAYEIKFEVLESSSNFVLITRC